MSIKVNCLACGHVMDLSDAYDDYEGEVRCWGCRAVIGVTVQAGKLKAMRWCRDVGPEYCPTQPVEPLQPWVAVLPADPITGGK